MIRNATVATKASWPNASAVPRLAAPNSSASADASANAPTEIAICFPSRIG